MAARPSAAETGRDELIRVLLVDDSARTRRGLRMRLGVEPDMDVVGEAEDGQTALALAARLHPEVVVMDLGLPDVDGVEVIRTLRHAHPATVVVVLSLYGDAVRRSAAQAAGAAAFVEKSGDCDALLGSIRAAVTSG